MLQRSRYRVTAYLFAAAVLTGCVVGPDFKRPQPPAPAAYRLPEDAPESATPAGSEPAAGAPQQQFMLGTSPAAKWWATFGSHELDAVVGEAIARNQTLAAAQASVAEARELVKAEAGNLYPQVSLDGGAGRQKYGAQFLSSSFVLPPFTYVGVGATVQYQVD